jgi:2-amino-4-hydroxy-6-hydroxymethyldihydropteridine diphosphokinase
VTAEREPVGLPWIPAYIGIGSNLDDPRAQVVRGFSALAHLRGTRLIAGSRHYRSTPLGPKEQPDYVNAVAGVLTRLDPEALLVELKRLEGELGRTQPITRWGPRKIDFDLLIYGEQRILTPSLTVPHAGIAERNFVLLPLADIAPDLLVPGLGSVRALASRAGLDGIEVLPLGS